MMTTIKPTQSNKKARNRSGSLLRRSWYWLLCCFAVCLWGNALQATDSSHTSYYLTEEDKTVAASAEENSLASGKSDSVAEYQVLVDQLKKLSHLRNCAKNLPKLPDEQLPHLLVGLDTFLIVQLIQ